MVSFHQSVQASSEVLVSELNGEAVLLHLKLERYFGMDATGTRMWQALTTAPTIERAYEILLGEYEVEPDRLREDLSLWIERLLAAEMITLHAA